MSGVFRDWSPPRPTVVTRACPGCGTAYPRALVLGLGLFDCGRCGTAVRSGMGPGVTTLKRQLQPEALVATTEVVESSRPKPKRWRRQDAVGKASTSVRTTETELEEWRAAAAANGESFNGWLRRNLGEAVALERANKTHPDDLPASKGTPETKENP